MSTESNDATQNPMRKLFLEQLHPQLIGNGFRQIENTEIEISEHRFKISYEISKTNVYGEVTTRKVDVLGMPMASTLILILGQVKDHDGPDIKIKLKAVETSEEVRSRIQNEFAFKLLEILAPKLDDLPVEIKVRFLKYLSAKDLSNLSSTNRDWLNICSNENSVWKVLYERDFRLNSTAHQGQNISWKEKYKRAFVQRKELKEQLEAHALVRGLPPPDPLLMLPYYPPGQMFPPPIPDMFPPPPNPLNPLFRPRGPFGPNGEFPFGPRGGFFGGF